MTEQTETPPPAAPRAILPARARTAAALAAVLAAVLVLTAPSAFAVLAPTAWLDRTSTSVASTAPPAPEPVRVTSADRLGRLFDRVGYDLDAVGEGAVPVPAIELAALPADLDDMRSVDDRKALFIRAVLPVVLRANAAVLEDRAALEAMLPDGGAARGMAQPGTLLPGTLLPGTLLPGTLQAEFRRIAGRYGAPDATADRDGIRALLRRVDAVPVSLAVAQAISESGWGTSRFARKGNALFGQWTWDPAAGIVPVERPQGRSHRVRAFRTLTDSAHAYLFNLNTHPAYEGFRKARAAARAEAGGLPEGRVLAGHLARYSERRHAYVQDIVELIRQNRLDRLDAAVLGEPSRYADADPLAAGLIDG